MSIHYKFKSANQYDTVTFDGLNISVKDLKKQIMQKKKFGKSSDFDLQITNAQTKETYTNENDLIPKNTSLIVARVPIAAPQKKWDRDNHAVGAKSSDIGDLGILNKGVNIAAMDISEEEKIKTMMSQSIGEYDPSNYVKVKGGNQVGPVPVHYVCYKCHQRGHWIKDCKANVDGQVGMPDAIKKSSGIPRSFMVPVDGPSVPGARLTPTGQFAVPAIDHEVYKEKKVERPPFLAEKEKPAETTTIPDDLMCVICKDLMMDAVMAPCCGNSFCDECIRNLLVESEEAECPECNEKEVSPDELIPNRFIRNAVNNFKNKTGYIKKADNSNKGPSPPRPSLPDFVPPVAVENGNTVVENKLPLSVASPSVDSSDKKPVETEEKIATPKAEQSPSREQDSGRERRSTSRSRTSASQKEKRRDRSSDADDLSSLSSRGSADRDSKGSPKRGESRREGYIIPSIVPPNPYNSHYRPMNQPPFMRGHDRSGTPTVDERYDPYGRPPVIGPPMGPMHGPMYNPQYPPPIFPYGNDDMRDRGRPYRGRYPPHYNDRLSRSHLPNDQEAAYQYFQNMLKKKNEWERERQKKKHGRSRSRSRPRSISRTRSRSHSNPKTSPSGRRRSFSPKRSVSRTRRSRSASRSPRGRSFVMSRSRSRSYTPKSPIDRKLSPRKFSGSPRSPRYDRAREYYGPEGNYEWDRRDRRGAYRTKARPQPLSPRQYSSYHRYRDEYDVPAPRNSPGRYDDRQYHEHDRRYHEGRSRRRSRSKSKGFFDDTVRHSETRERRSASRGRRDRSPDPRRRSRERRSRDRGERHNSPERSRDKERKKRTSSTDRKRSSKDRSRSKSRRSRSREQKKRSESPRKERKKSRSPDVDDERNLESPVHNETPEREKSPSPENDPVPAVEEPLINKHLWKPIAENRFENEPLERNPSPMVSEKSPKSVGKKEKKKDKEKKKRKKEKETDEEKEARRKRKKEKKEEKKKKEVVVTESTPEHAKIKESAPELLTTGAYETEEGEIPAQTETSVEEEKANTTADTVAEPAAELEADDVLDLHPSTEDLVASEMLAPMPELSRWELEEPMTALPTTQASPETARENAVTNEVLKRAENAIFKKAISAIRPEHSTKKHTDKSDDRKSRHATEPDREKRVVSPEREKRKEATRKGKDEESGKRVLTREDPVKRSKEEPSRRVEVKEKSTGESVREVDRILREVPSKMKTDVRKPGNSIQITIPVAIEKDERGVGFGAEKMAMKVTSQPRLSILERLGGKVDEASGGLTPAIDDRDKKQYRMAKAQAETSDENEEHSKTTSSLNRSRSPEVRKRRRSSSMSSEDSVKVSKKKHSKHKKDKKNKKKNRREISESSDSSDPDEKKKRKKNKKNKKSRH